MGFEVFVPTRTDRGRRSEPTMHCSRKAKRIALSKASAALLPKACTHVVLAFDVDTRQVAIIATAPTDPKAIRLIGSDRRQISVANFLDHFSIAEGRYPVTDTKVHDRAALVSTAVESTKED